VPNAVQNTYEEFGETLLKLRSIGYWLAQNDSSTPFRLGHHFPHLNTVDFVHHVKHDNVTVW